MSKKILGGALALLFIVSFVQTKAILALSNRANTSSDNSVAMAPVEYDYQNQQAATGLATTIVNPEPAGIVIRVEYFGSSCFVSYYDSPADADSNTPSHVYTGNTGNGPNGQYCDYQATLVGPSSAGAGKDIPIGNVSVSVSGSGSVAIFSSNAILEQQYKLYVTGYLEHSQITGKVGSQMTSAIETFQSVNGISPVGTFGSQTKVAMDKKVSSTKAILAFGNKFNFSK